MPKRCLPLTKAQVKKSTPGLLFDGGGLYLETTTQGSKLWRMKYSYQGKDHRISLGKYPLVSLTKARRLRDEVQDSLAQGINPRPDENESERLRIRDFEGVAREWYALWSRDVVPKHAKQVLVRLERDVFPQLGTIPIKELTAMQVLAVLKGLGDRGHLVSAQRTNLVIGQIIKYSIATGLASYDCRAGLSKVLRTPVIKHFPAIEADELPTLLERIDSPETGLYSASRIALKLLLLTMVRPNELMGASWAEFNFEKLLWTIPSNRMKARKEHYVPLSHQALVHLTRARSLAGDSPWVIPSSLRPGKHMHYESATRSLVALGYEGRLTAHGIRSLCAGLLISRGHSIDVVDAALAHEQSRVRRAYFRHPDLSSRRAMFEDLGNHLETLGLRL